MIVSPGASSATLPLDMWSLQIKDFFSNKKK